MIRIEIETGNAAFHVQSSDEHNGEPNTGPEVCRILRNLVETIEIGRLLIEIENGEEFGLLDLNGNRCGKLVVE